MVRPPYEFQFFLLKAYFIIIFSKSSCPSQGVPLSLLVVQACVLGRSVVSDSATPGTVTRQAPPSMGFSRQEYWSGLPLPSPGDLRHPRIKPMSPATSALANGFFTTEPPGKPHW